MFIGKGRNHPKTIRYLNENGYRTFRSQEEILSYMPELIVELKGNWLWTDIRKGLKEGGIRTLDEKGKLHVLTGKETIDQCVCLFPGNQPMSLDIYSDDNAIKYGRRFDLDMDTKPDKVASVIVGLARDTPERCSGDVNVLLKEIEDDISRVQQKVARLAEILRPTKE